MTYCLQCKYLNTVRYHPIIEDGDRFYCHIIDLYMTRSHAGCISCIYFKQGKQTEGLPVMANEDDES